jgi:hypothetical protein
VWCGEAFNRLWIQNVDSLILIDVSFLLVGKEKRRKEKSTWGRNISLGLDPSCWLNNRL